MIMDKNTKILLIAGVGLFLLVWLKKSGTMGSGESVTETRSAAEGWLNGMGNFHNTLNDSINRNINNATDQVIKLGDKISEWRNSRLNNAREGLRW